MELRSEMWDNLARPKTLADLCRIADHGPSSKGDVSLMRCALHMVLGEIGARAQARLDVGGVLP